MVSARRPIAYQQARALMAATVLDGKALAGQLEMELSARIRTMKARAQGLVPALAIMRVGGDARSAAYVRMKIDACRRVGMQSVAVALEASITTGELLTQLDRLNADPTVHGIFLQYPVPPHIDERRCFDRIAFEKDVDGVSALGFGAMAMNEGAFGCAASLGIMRLLQHHGIRVAGLHAVVVGRSPTFGKPMAMMLLNADATVTVCHSKSHGLQQIVGSADILVVAGDEPGLIRGSWVRRGAVLIDAGYCSGGIGDIEMSQAIDRCSAYTPVRGGVGPMTIATLMAQTVDAAEKIGR